MNPGFVCIDANVLLEIILGRTREHVARKVVREVGLKYISTLSAHLIIHFGQERVNLPVLRLFLSDYQLLSLEPVDFEWAFNNALNRDFEDALQIGVAVRHGCKQFITLDKELYRDYKHLQNIQITFVN